MSINANEVVSFLLKWLAIGLVLHFGLKLGELIDGALPFI